MPSSWNLRNSQIRTQAAAAVPLVRNWASVPVVRPGLQWFSAQATGIRTASGPVSTGGPCTSVQSYSWGLHSSCSSEAEVLESESMRGTRTSQLLTVNRSGRHHTHFVSDPISLCALESPFGHHVLGNLDFTLESIRDPRISIRKMDKHVPGGGSTL